MSSRNEIIDAAHKVFCSAISKTSTRVELIIVYGEELTALKTAPDASAPEDDICKCGDYRKQHVDGTGACRLNGLGHGGPSDCTKFELDASGPTDNGAAPQLRKFIFHVDAKRYELDAASIRGIDIKRAANLKEEFHLFIESEPDDHLVSDDYAALEFSDGQHFYSVPPAIFASAPTVEEWQGMDSAPKDGTCILVSTADAAVCIAGWSDEFGWCQQGADYAFHNLVAWQPRPSPCYAAAPAQEGGES